MRRVSLLVACLILSLLAGAAPAQADELPGTYYVKPLPIRMEQSGPTCVVFAGMLAMMVQDYPENGNRFPRYDWQEAWNTLASRGQASDRGSSVPAFLSFVRDTGLRPIAQPRQRVLRAWRDGRGGYVRRWWSQPYRSPAFGGRRSRIAGFTQLDPFNVEDIQRAIMASGPVILSLGWDLNWGNTLPDGRFKEPVGVVAAGHAVVLYGWTHDATGELLWYVANSYGEMFGLKGLSLFPDHLRPQHWWYVHVIHDIDQ